MTEYTYTRQVYKNVPFKYVVRKKGYYDIAGFALQNEVPIIVNSTYHSYSGLTLSSEQISGSLMTVSIAGGELPDKNYCETTLGCLATAGQIYTVETSGGTETAIGLLPSGVVDDGSAKTWNLFYNDGVFLLDTDATKSGYSWCGTINISSHSV